MTRKKQEELHCKKMKSTFRGCVTAFLLYSSEFYIVTLLVSLCIKGLL